MFLKPSELFFSIRFSISFFLFESQLYVPLVCQVTSSNHILTLFNLSNAGSSPAGSVGRDLNLQKLNYQMLNH